MSDVKYLTCAETAKLVRQALKAQFPRTKFSVKSHTYSMGASIDVTWTDGPTDREVSAVTELYRGAEFDGMIDLKSHHDTVLASADGTVEVVSMGADFIFTHRKHSEEFMARRREAAKPNGYAHGEQCPVCYSRMEGGAYTTRVRTGAGSTVDIVCSPDCAARRSAQYVRGVNV